MIQQRLQDRALCIWESWSSPNRRGSGSAPQCSYVCACTVFTAAPEKRSVRNGSVHGNKAPGKALGQCELPLCIPALVPLYWLGIAC